MSIYDKASLVLIPSGTKTSKVFSQKPVNGDGDFTFSRSTAATRVNADGNIEKETQNKLTYSNTFDQWSPKRGTLSQGVTDPFGGNNAWSLTATDIDPYLYNQTAWSGVVTLSIWAKGVGSSIGKPIQLRMGGSFEEFTLTGDWQRFEKFTNGSASNIGIEVPNPAVAGDVVHIYGAQLEDGLVARDYIETTTAAVEGGITDNVPRLDYTDSSCPALLLEPQRFNAIDSSEYAGDWAAIDSNITKTDNATTSPEGVDNAVKLEGLTGSGGNQIVNFGTFILNGVNVVGKTYTASVYIKPVNAADVGDNITLTIQRNSGDFEGYNVTTEITSADWKRYDLTYTFTGAGAGNQLGANFKILKGSTTIDDIYIWGVQLEEGSYATSYIPTYGTSVTRNVDSCLATSVSDVIGQTEGTLFMDADFIAGSGEDQTILIGVSGYNDYVFIQMTSGNRVEGGIIVNSTEHCRIGEVKPSGRYKCAFAYANNDFVFYINGEQIGVETSGSMSGFAVDFINLNFNNKGYSLNNHSLFKTRLSNEELAALTTI